MPGPGLTENGDIPSIGKRGCICCIPCREKGADERVAGV